MTSVAGNIIDHELSMIKICIKNLDEDTSTRNGKKPDKLFNRRRKREEELLRKKRDLQDTLTEVTETIRTMTNSDVGLTIHPLI